MDLSSSVMIFYLKYMYLDIDELLYNCLMLFQKPWKAGDPWPKEAAEAHFLIGMCNIELKTYIRALEAFSEAIKLNSNYPDVRNIFLIVKHLSYCCQLFRTLVTHCQLLSKNNQ